MATPDTAARRPTSTPFYGLVETELRLPPGTLGSDANERWICRPPPVDRVGVALSGGGIRSATFNLGLLQGLERVGLLPCLDYISTVSGGGYIGGFWSAWRHHRLSDAKGAGRPAVAGPERTGDTVDAPNPASFPRAEEGLPEAASVRHLREFSNFLSPRVGLLSVDTGRLVVAAVGAALPSLLATLSLLVLVLYVWARLGQQLLSPRPGAGWISYAVLGGITAAVLVWMELRWRGREEADRDDLWAAAAGLVAAMAGVLGVYAWMEGAGVLDAWSARPRSFSMAPFLAPADLARWTGAFLPAAPWAVTALALLLTRAVLSRFVGGVRAVRARAAVDRVTARLLLLAGLWVVVAAVWLAGLWIYDWAQMGLPTYIGVTGIGAAAFAWARKRMGDRIAQGGLGRTLLERLQPRLPQILAYAVVALLAGGVVVLLLRGAAGGWWDALLAGAVAVTLLTLVLFDPNRLGLHSFYRGRIARAYLGAARAREHHPRRTEEQKKDDISLDRLQDGDGGPVHLVCCTANDLTPAEPLANLSRGGRSAVLSRAGFLVDDAWRPWKEDAPTLGSALTASAAAFNPLMGAYSVRFGPAVIFLMAALNLRLGRWIRHPREEGHAKHWAFPGFLFYKEMFGISSAQKNDVHLSDGGHFENMGLYELIRRHCRYIIAADCGADADVSFNDIGELTRKVREDFGVEIRLDLTPLRPDADGRVRQRVVAGDILYPEGPAGTLLLFKPGLAGDEPADIIQYKGANPVFPHQSTVDQFYDSAQWESYRRLGQYAAEATFAFARADIDWWPESPERGMPVSQRREAVPALFARARFQWLPAPAGYDAAMDDFMEGMAELDELLARPEQRVMRGQVYSELPALVAQAEGGSPRTTVDAAALGPSLEAARRGLDVLQRAWRDLELDARHTDPRVLPVMNAMGRWSSAPLLRLWWPLLRPLHDAAFASFLEERFGLASWRTMTASLDALPPEDARVAGLVELWRASMDGRGAASGGEIVAWGLALPSTDGKVLRVHPALVRLEVLEPMAGARVALWTPEDLFVAPGLWGVGIGSAMLGALRSLEGQDDPSRLLHGTRWLLVRVPDGDTVQRRKGHADADHLYRGAGFEAAPTDEHGQLVLDGLTLDPLPSRLARPGGRWLRLRTDPGA